MSEPIDLVWIGVDGHALRIDNSVGPGRLRTCRAARSVIECVPGEADLVLAWL